MTTPQTETQSRRKDVFVLGYDDQHKQDIEDIYDPKHVSIHSLLSSDELINQDTYDVDGLLNKTRAILSTFDHVDGIVCHWDFPAVFIHSILCQEYALPAPSLVSLLKCAHKYWGRLEQQRIVPECTPEFSIVDPFDDHALEKITVDFPFWLKPIKGYSSVLGFHVTNPGDFDYAIEESRKTIGELGDPFNNILGRVDLPADLQQINGNAMIAEQYISGKEFAPEGHVQHGKCHVHGLIDMVIGSNGKSFERYEYPSTAPESVQQRAVDLTQKLMENIGFDNGCFNIEFFWNEDTDRLWIVEVNPRISQSHSYLFEKVNGMSNHEIAISVALGEKPHFSGKGGPFRCAAKFLHRRYSKENMIATRVPQKRDIEALQELQNDTVVHLRLQEGAQLVEMKEQDPYSYVIADFLIAAQSREELEQKYRQAAEHLPFDFTPLSTD